MSSFTRNKTLNNHDLTAQERNDLITLLCEDHSFNLDKLLQWLASLRHPAFWDADIAQKELNYSPAQALYLSDVYAKKHGHDYETGLRVMAELMWEGRGDAAPVMTFGVNFSPAMDAALMMLAEHMEHFKVLQAFDQAKFRAGPMPLDEVAMYAELFAGQYTSYEATEFALEWLSFHLPYYAKGHRDGKAQAAQARRAQSSGSDDSTMWGMEPGGLEPGAGQ